VLLSQPHRLRALILLSQFVDLGPWAATVHLVLSIGIFPYISKLLQAAGQELRPVLIFIWARILAVDASVQIDLHQSHGYKYHFANVLAVQEDSNHLVFTQRLRAQGNVHIYSVIYFTSFYYITIDPQMHHNNSTEIPFCRNHFGHHLQARNNMSESVTR
jgi:hypothetical protein